MACTCESAKKLKQEIETKDRLIDILREALNDPRYCEDHIIVRKCSKKDLQCGDCIVEEFYDHLTDD